MTAFLSDRDIAMLRQRLESTEALRMDAVAGWQEAEADLKVLATFLARMDPFEYMSGAAVERVKEILIKRGYWSGSGK